MSSKYTINRRDFMRVGTLGTATFSLGMIPNPLPAKPVAPSDKITIGMIGVGARAHQLIETIKEFDDTEIVAVCDAYTGRVERAVARTDGQARAYKDYREIINRDDIDVVVIATPDHWHAVQAVDAMNAGKHVYLEKPLTYTINEGRAIVEAQKKNNVAVQVGSPGPNDALAQHARSLIKSGKLGQITMLRAYTNRNTASGAWIYPIPPDASPQTVDWDLFLGSAPKRPYSPERFFRWRCYKDYSGGMSTDLFVHTCTGIHYIMDVDMCSSAMAMGGLYRWKNSRDVPDTINASLKYPEGFLVSLSGTFSNQGGGGSGLQILGTEGSLHLGRELTFIPENVHESNGWIVESWTEEMQRAYYEDPDVRTEEMPWTNDPAVIQGREVYSSEGINSLYMHFDEFFEAVRNGTPTKEDALVGHYAASCAHMINMALDKRAEVVWDERNATVAGG